MPLLHKTFRASPWPFEHPAVKRKCMIVKKIFFKQKYYKKKFTHLLKSLLNTCAPWKTSFIFVTFATFCELDKSVENTLVNEK